MSDLNETLEIMTAALQVAPTGSDERKRFMAMIEAIIATMLTERERSAK